MYTGVTNVFEIPLSMLDDRNLERFLQERAEDGYLIKAFIRNFQKGKFERLPGSTSCHFSVVYYEKKITEEVEQSEDFIRFQKEAKEKGWIFQCSYKNLAVFYSCLKERPPQIQSDARQKENRRKITLKEERKCFFWQSFFWFLYMVWLLILVAPWNWKVYDDRLFSRGIFLSLFFFLMLWQEGFILWRWIYQKRKVKKEEQFSETMPLLWDTNLILSFPLGIAGVILGTVSFLRGGLFSAVYAEFAGMLCLGYLAFRLYKRNIVWFRTVWQELGTVVLMVVLSLLCITHFPMPDTYRFQNENGSWVKGWSREEWESDPPGLSLTDVGISLTEESWSQMYENQPGYLVTSEEILYDMREFEYSREMRKKKPSEVARQLQYVGTLKAQLKKENRLESYLRQKGMKLSEMTPVSFMEGVDSFLSEDKKTMVHQKGTTVVIHFLNEYQKTQFDTKNPQQKAAVVRSLKTALEKWQGGLMYRM